MDKNGLILSIDQGTTSSRALVFDAQGAIVTMAQKELNIQTPHAGWVEQDATQIWADVQDVCAQVLDHDYVEQIIGIAITNQRETTIVWDKETGKPVYNAIVWQDRRTADMCKSMADHTDEIQDKTGLVIDPYFSATKIKWILDHYDGPTDNLLFGTVDCYLLWNLTGGKVHATDASNAARTMLFNIHEQQWDVDLCALLDIPLSMLPAVCDNLHDFGEANIADKNFPVLAMAGDQQAATFGQACFQKGMVKSTYGTGCFTLMNTGEECVRSQNKLLSTIAWRIDGKLTYALEGSIFVAGAAVQFLRDQFEFFDHSNETEAMAQSVDDTDGVVFVPCLSGLGAPHWDPHAKGAVFGLSRGTQKAHIVRACLDAQAFQTRDLLTAMSADAKQGIETIRVDGGLSNNNYVCEQISTVCNVTVERPINTEATAWGVAAMAFMQAGVFASFKDIENIYNIDRTFVPHTDGRDKCDSAYHIWSKAIEAVQSMP